MSYYFHNDLFSGLVCSDAIGLFGALLRLKEWHNAYIEIVVPDSSHKVFFRTLNNWRESLGVARVWSASEWKPASGILWRGHINISEQKVQRGLCIQDNSFPRREVSKTEILYLIELCHFIM